MTFALKAAPNVRKAVQAAVEKQRGTKLQKQEMLQKKKFVAAQREYANALTFIEMYHSAACWKTGAVSWQEYSKLGSKTAKLEAVKEQI